MYSWVVARIKVKLLSESVWPPTYNTLSEIAVNSTLPGGIERFVQECSARTYMSFRLADAKLNKRPVSQFRAGIRRRLIACEFDEIIDRSLCDAERGDAIDCERRPDAQPVQWPAVGWTG